MKFLLSNLREEKKSEYMAFFACNLPKRDHIYCIYKVPRQLESMNWRIQPQGMIIIWYKCWVIAMEKIPKNKLLFFRGHIPIVWRGECEKGEMKEITEPFSIRIINRQGMWCNGEKRIWISNAVLMFCYTVIYFTPRILFLYRRSG